tara:strand:+ start:69 stop:737 length:669 start_codon:yes stop_codon:yes gene_type:complete
LNEEEVADVDQEDRYLFYEWLTNEIKDELFKNWIKIHQERAKYVAPRFGIWDSSDRTANLYPKKIEKPSDACSFNLYNIDGAVPYARTQFDKEEQALKGVWDRDKANKAYQEANELLEIFHNSYKEIKMHLNEIKLKFPYDLFWQFDCQKKMKRLDFLVNKTIECPYPPDYSMTVSEVLSTKNLKGAPTPYEKCVIEFKMRDDAEAEVETVGGEFDLQEYKT